ncbi:MAG: spore germination protein [Clostridiales bacterium]|nr:spore germination protein [Clostridiales bacterium]MCI6613237.1 spore germination protein [Clostridiales bacterium]
MNRPFDTRCAQLDDLLGVGRSFDMVSRELYIGGCRAKMWVVNGYAKDMLLERTVEKLQAVKTLEDIGGVDDLLRRYITVCDAETCQDRMQAVTDVFSGKTLLVVEGFDGGILLDAKEFPTRSVQEPDAGKVLRGSHDGFVENIMENAALLRRRIRDPALTLERIRVSGRSKCDAALCYMEGQADPKILAQLRDKLRNATIRSVAMSQESVAEAIAPPQWYNPFPKVRYTERPDVATASVLEGDILVLIDNTPVVMVLPVSLLRFNEEINDYYFPPLVGTYLRIIRFCVMLLNVIVTPLWYLLATEPNGLPEPWDFLLVEGEYAVPLIGQLLLVELIIDVLKLASLNTPDVLGNSFSMLGALILGDFAVQSRWLVPEVLVYMAFVAVSNFAQHSFEMGYACKLCRMALVLLAFALRWWGFGIGLAGVLVLMATAKPIVGKGYLYPLIPWDGKALRSLLLRRPANKNNT